jgi:hypothetical protein
VATYKYALLLSLADLAIERGDDETAELSLDTLDLAEKFVELYWRQALPWVPRGQGEPRRLHQNTGREAAILRHLAQAHERWQGSLPHLKNDTRAWRTLLQEVARVIEVMPLWKLQTVGRRRLDFLYPNVISSPGRAIAWTWATTTSWPTRAATPTRATDSPPSTT